MLLNRDRALDVMERHELDALVASTPENVYYLSDSGTEHSFHFALQGLTAAVFPRDETIPATLIVQGWELPDQAERRSWMPELRVQAGYGGEIVAEGVDLGPSDRRLLDLLQRSATGLSNRQRVIGQTLRDLGLTRGRLGFDDVRVMLELSETDIPDAQTIDALNVFREIRVVKTPEEIHLLTHATRLVQAAVMGMAALCKESVTVRELLRYFRSHMALQGGYGSHGIWGGVDRPWVSYPNEEYPLKKGDIVLLDPAGHYRHYWADLGRTAVIGPTSKKFDDYYSTLVECHREVIPRLQAGISTRDVNDTAREVARRLGVIQPSGLWPFVHSIGIDQYDHPQTVGEFLTDDFVLEVNMVVNFETIYMELGWGMLQLEDTYLIEKSGAKRLDTLPMEAFSFDVGP